MWRTLAIVCFLLCAAPAFATADFTRPLKLGMTGEDVRALQVLLNKSADTRIAESGVGSPGQETTYFGLRTQQAVVRFQEKYRTVTLLPNGLTKGTGFVGLSTIGVLNKIKDVSHLTKATPPVQTEPVRESPPKAKLPGNTEGLPGTLAAIERVGVKKGLSSAEIEKLKSLVSSQIAATTTPLLASFVKQVMQDNPGQKPITLNDQLRTLTFSFRNLFFPTQALADGPFGTYGHNGACTESEIASNLYVNKLGTTFLYCDYTWGDTPPVEAALLREQGLSQVASGVSNAALGAASAAAGVGLPFGGAIVGTPVWCLCTASWWIPITPLPPTFPEALMYYPGSQAFLTYNIPATLWMLGFYEPGPQCLIYDGDSCIPLPVQGLITPIVGSSPL